MKIESARRGTTAARRAAPWRGEVVEVTDEHTVQLRRVGAASTVEPAEIAVPAYRARVGDRVVVDGGGDGWFVIGVLGAARLRSPLRVEGDDVVLEARGRLHVRAGGAIDLEASRIGSVAEEVAIAAGRLEVGARRLVERVEDAYREASGLSQTRAGRLRCLVEGALDLVARRTTVQSEEDTVVDGRRVLLG